MRKGTGAMRFTRIIAGAVTAGLVGLAPVAVGSPANAAVTYTTTATAAASAPGVVYGDDISINGAVTDVNGGSVYTGTASLQVYSAKNPVWTTIQVDESAGSYFFFDVKPDSNSQYKVVYSGITETNGDVYLPTESAPVSVAVQRKVKANNRVTTFFGKITPDYAKKAVKVERKFGKNWRKYKVIKTDKKGKWRIKLPAPSRKKTFWRFSIADDANFVGWSATGWTRRY